MTGASPLLILGDSPSINLLVKLPGTRCNLSCDYCFEHQKGIIDVPGIFVSSEQIKRILCDSVVPMNLVFHGGEPLLASANYYSSLLSSLRSHRNKIKTVQIQTNGTLLSQRFIDLFWKEFSDFSVEISISLDGNAEMNTLRKAQEKETFSTVMRSFELLHKNGISAGVLSVIHKESLKKPEQYIDFFETIPNIRFIKMNPLHLVSKNGELLYDSIAPSDFSYFVISVFSRYVEKKLYERFPLEPCLSIIQTLSKVETHYCNYSNRKCSNFICLYPDDTLSLCDSLPYKEYSFSSLKDRKKCIQPLLSMLADCSHCDYLDFCRCGCLGIRHLFKDSPLLKKDYCKSKIILYDFFTKVINEVQS